MDIKVGSYVLNGEFKDKKDAKETFLNHFPVVTEKDLYKQLDKLFKNANKSNNTPKEDKRVDQTDSEIGSGSIKGK